MKQFISLLLVLSVSLFSINSDAQNSVRKNKRVKRTVVVKKKKNNKKTIVSKKRRGKKGRVSVKRTKVVHHNYKHLPKRGKVVTKVHRSAKRITYKNYNYRFYNGIWYKPYGKKWVISRPVFGVRLRVLPIGYRRCYIGPRVYFYYYGTYYQKVDSEYIVIKAPINAEIDSLPEGYNTISVNNTTYYELDDIYYMPSTNSKGEEILIVVENPNI